MNIESPFKGVANELLWFLVGLFCLFLGSVNLTKYGFPSEPTITWIWTIFGLLLSFFGFFIMIVGFVFFLLKPLGYLHN